MNFSDAQIRCGDAISVPAPLAETVANAIIPDVVAVFKPVGRVVVGEVCSPWITI